MHSWTVWGLTAITNSLRVASTRTIAKQTVHYTLSRWSINATTFIKLVLWITTHLEHIQGLESADAKQRALSNS